MRWKGFAGLLLSLVLLFFIVSKVDFGQLVDALRSAQYSLLFLAAFLHIFTLLVRAWRWRYLMAPLKPIRVMSLLSAISIGFMANMILPARTGEVVRAYVIGQKEQVSKVASFATIVLERLFDLGMVLLIVLFLLVFFGTPLNTGFLVKGFEKGVVFFLVALILCIGFFYFFKLRKVEAEKLRAWFLSKFPEKQLKNIREKLQAFVVGLQSMKKGGHLFQILLTSSLLWLTMVFANFLVLRSFHLDLPVYAPFVLLVAQVLGVMIPSSPGFIGTYHAAVVASFALFEVPGELALSAAIVMHASFFFPFILIGFIFLWRENMGLQALWPGKTAGSSS